MSIKALIQFFILLLIVTIISTVYFKYFESKKNFVEDISLLEKNRDEQLEKLEKKIEDLEKRNTQLNNKIEDNRNKSFQKKSPEIKEEVKNSKNTKSETKVEKVNVNNYIKIYSDSTFVIYTITKNWKRNANQEIYRICFIY